jgi:hypothetical protein
MSAQNSKSSRTLWIILVCVLLVILISLVNRKIMKDMQATEPAVARSVAVPASVKAAPGIPAAAEVSVEETQPVKPVQAAPAHTKRKEAAQDTEIVHEATIQDPILLQ